tara:strand:+ start:1244 stop:1498 length:255 start_codon:yes stop_codon:yes gene_type:complete
MDIQGLNKKIETLKDKVETRTRDKQVIRNCDRIVKLNKEFDELETSYYKLRSELNGVYKVLEMNADDIQALQNKVFNGLTRDIK